MKGYIPSLLVPVLLFTLASRSQMLTSSMDKGLQVIEYTDRNDSTYTLPESYPLFSFKTDGRLLSTADANQRIKQDGIYLEFPDGIEIKIERDQDFTPNEKYIFDLVNNSGDTIDIGNFVPFGEIESHIYLTSSGPWALARAKIFRPGLGPVGVILPDNAWEMGYGAIRINEDMSVCALARRTGHKNSDLRRYRTIVYPGGSVTYSMWVDTYKGDWQNGLKIMFHDHYLFDLQSFNDSLYRRADLEWIRHAYIIGLQFAWNKDYYDWQKQEYTADNFLEEGKALFGGYDVLGLWPTWPTLGVDPRNQWDLFADLPGGLPKLREMSQQWKKQGTRFFICYNPWDESTRSEDPYSGMAKLIDATDADGVVLDCSGSSSYELQKAADSVRPGVIMYSEGMAVVKDMPGIVAGRVHDAIYLPPPLNLNKLIKPDFAIFRVCQVHDGRIRREASIAFFNGYGTELNTFAPAQMEDMEEDLIYLGKTTRLLRENTSCFLSPGWTPLLPTLADSIWVNEWPEGDKTLYTIFSLIPQGYDGPLFTSDPMEGYHAVSLWRHEELEWIKKDSSYFLPAKTEAFDASDMGTRTEGNIDCIALLPSVLNVSLREGYLNIDAAKGDEIRVWNGDPSYRNDKMLTLGIGNPHRLNVPETFNNIPEKIVIELFDNNELMDERIFHIQPGTPFLISRKGNPKNPGTDTKGMILIHGGPFEFKAENTDQFIPYPDTKEPVTVNISPYYIDKYPVTNSEFAEFLTATDYKPADTVNFLRHWIDGKIPEGLENHPVVYVSPEDAKAYAHWCGKRLPTETEWQYAAQGKKNYTWPWGNEFDSTRCNNAAGHTTPVDAFPRGKSPFGVMDMTGNVWQLTGDIYDNGTYYFVIMKGGSFYKPTSSWWYVKGGPRPNTWHQQLLLVSPSFDRNSTVGFRCVKDAAPDSKQAIIKR